MEKKGDRHKVKKNETQNSVFLEYEDYFRDKKPLPLWRGEKIQNWLQEGFMYVDFRDNGVVIKIPVEDFSQVEDEFQAATANHGDIIEEAVKQKKLQAKAK